MMRARLLSIVVVAGFLAPITGMAQSYITPEQFLQENDNAFLIPSGPRGAKWHSDMNAQLNLDRHPSIIREPWDAIQDDGLPPPAIADNDHGNTENFSPVEPTPTYGGLDPTTARLLARLVQQNSLFASSLQSTAGANGAPLAGTGPASAVAAIVMAAATFWTLRRARTLERFVREL